MIWLLRENWLWFALSFLLGATTTWLLFTRRTIIETDTGEPVDDAGDEAAKGVTG